MLLYGCLCLALFKARYSLYFDVDVLFIIYFFYTLNREYSSNNRDKRSKVLVDIVK